MKRLKWSEVMCFVLLVFALSGCAATKRVLKDVFWPDFTVIPPPQAGLILPIHVSPAVWVEAFLLEGSFSEKKVFTTCFNRRDCMTFVKTPIKHFVIEPPKGQPSKRSAISWAKTFPLLVSTYPADYTLVFFYQNFVQRMISEMTNRKGEWKIPFIKLEVKPFSTTGYPLNENYKKIYYADKVIRLARVRPYERRQLRVHRTFYPGHALKEALGLP